MCLKWSEQEGEWQEIRLELGKVKSDRGPYGLCKDFGFETDEMYSIRGSEQKNDMI